jgi:FkbM family methyltransferase
VNPISTLRFILDHPLNRGRPISAISRYLGWQVQSRLEDEVIVDWIEDTKLAARRGMTGATGNIYCGLHEFADMAFVLHALRPGDLFVDVGANIGSYTILASGVYGAHSIAIEPDAGAARHLARNIAVNGLEGLVDAKQTAVGEQSSNIAFTTGQDTTNRVATDADRDVQVIPLARLDDLLDCRDPTLIKLDVEGYETHALPGAEKSLANPSLLAVLLETVDDEALAALTRHGMMRHGYNPRTRRLLDGDNVAREANVLFVRDAGRLQERLSSAPRLTYRRRQI